jgi:hypothetical protein
MFAWPKPKNSDRLEYGRKFRGYLVKPRDDIEKSHERAADRIDDISEVIRSTDNMPI